MTPIVSVCPVCSAPLRYASADCCSLACRDIQSERVIARTMRRVLGMAAEKQRLRRYSQRRKPEAAT